VSKWILIIYIAKELWLPLLSFDSEDDCYAYIEEMELAPGVHATCLSGVIEKEREKKHERKHERRTPRGNP
jgi:hypothetical protein